MERELWFFVYTPKGLFKTQKEILALKKTKEFPGTRVLPMIL